MPNPPDRGPCLILSFADLRFNHRLTFECRVLAEAGYAVQVIHRSGPGLGPLPVLPEGVLVFTIEERRAGGEAALGRSTGSGRFGLAGRAGAFLGRLGRVWRRLASARPVVLQCHGLAPLMIGLAYCFLHPGTRLIFDCLEDYEGLPGLTPGRRRLFSWMLAAAASRVEVIFVPSAAIGTRVLERHPRFPAPTTLHNAFTGPMESSNGTVGPALLGLEPGERALVFQGALVPHRRLEAVVKAGAALPEPWHLVIVGDGFLRAKLEKLARRLDPEGRKVLFLGPVPAERLDDFTASADLGLIPYEEGASNHDLALPNKIWQFTAAGVPLLVSDCRTMADLVNRHGLGRVLPPAFAPGDLVKSVSTMDEAELERCRADCLRFTEHHGWRETRRVLLEAYEQLLREKRKSA